MISSRRNMNISVNMGGNPHHQDSSIWTYNDEMHSTNNYDPSTQPISPFIPTSPTLSFLQPERPPSMMALDIAQGLYDFTATEDSCLSFLKGAILHVLNKDDSGWWDCVCDGERGWVPSNYVSPLKDLDDSNISTNQQTERTNSTESLPPENPENPSQDIHQDTSLSDFMPDTPAMSNCTMPPPPQNDSPSSIDDIVALVNESRLESAKLHATQVEYHQARDSVMPLNDHTPMLFKGMQISQVKEWDSLNGNASAANVVVEGKEPVSPVDSVQEIPSKRRPSVLSTNTLESRRSHTGSTLQSTSGGSASQLLISPPPPLTDFPRPTWDLLVNNILGVISDLNTFAKASHHHSYVRQAYMISKAVKNMLFCSGTLSPNSYIVREFGAIRSHQYALTAGVARLIVACKCASGTWPPSDAVPRMRQQAGQVLLAIRHFVSVAQELKLKLVAVEEGASMGNLDSELFDFEHRCAQLMDIDFINRIESERQRVFALLSPGLQQLVETQQSDDLLMADMRETVMLVGQLLSLLDDLRIVETDEQETLTVLDAFFNGRTALSTHVQELVNALKAGMESQQKNVLAWLMSASKLVLRATDDVAYAAKLVLERQERIQLLLLENDLCVSDSDPETEVHLHANAIPPIQYRQEAAQEIMGLKRLFLGLRYSGGKGARGQLARVSAMLYDKDHGNDLGLYEDGEPPGMPSTEPRTPLTPERASSADPTTRSPQKEEIKRPSPLQVSIKLNDVQNENDDDDHHSGVQAIEIRRLPTAMSHDQLNIQQPNSEKPPPGFTGLRRASSPARQLTQARQAAREAVTSLSSPPEPSSKLETKESTGVQVPARRRSSKSSKLPSATPTATTTKRSRTASTQGLRRPSLVDTSAPPVRVSSRPTSPTSRPKEVEPPMPPTPTVHMDAVSPAASTPTSEKEHQKSPDPAIATMKRHPAIESDGDRRASVASHLSNASRHSRGSVSPAPSKSSINESDRASKTKSIFRKTRDLSPAGKGPNGKGEMAKVAKFFGEDVTRVMHSRVHSQLPLSGPRKLWFLGYNYPPEDISFNSEGQVNGGTLPALVERLTLHDAAIDGSFSSAFMLTFRCFMKPTDLCKLLMERFVIDPPSGLGEEHMILWTEKKLLPTRLRVYNLLKLWLDQYFVDGTDDAILDLLETFCHGDMERLMPMASYRLNEMIQRKASPEETPATTRSPKAHLSGGRLPHRWIDGPTPILGRGFSIRNRGFNIQNVDPLEVARQITVLMCKIYLSIKPEELLAPQYLPENRPPSATTSVRSKSRFGKNVNAMSSLSTQLTNWVSESIVSRSDVKKRTLMIKFWIKVCDRCWSLNNLDAVMAILSALNSSTVERLKRTWELLSAKTMTTFQTIKRISDFTRNYARYRQYLKSIDPPCLPFLGLYLTDLTFVNQGSSNWRDEEKRVLNFEKYARTARILQEIQHFQVPFSIVEVTDLQKYIESQLEQSDGRNPDELYRMSLIREPKETSQTSNSHRPQVLNQPPTKMPTGIAKLDPTKPFQSFTSATARHTMSAATIKEALMNSGSERTLATPETDKFFPSNGKITSPDKSEVTASRRETVIHESGAPPILPPLQAAVSPFTPISHDAALFAPSPEHDKPTDVQVPSPNDDGKNDSGTCIDMPRPIKEVETR